MQNEIDLSIYPDGFSGYIGNTTSVQQLRLSIASARKRRAMLDHTLLCGPPGTGKTALALLAAREMTKGRKGARWTIVQPPITWIEWFRLTDEMADGDVVVVDECQRLVEGGKAKSSWLLGYLQDGVLMSGRGPLEMPKVTIIGATTDPEKLPPAILSRFQQPPFEPYSDDEAAKIAAVMSKDVLGVEGLALPTPENCRVLAGAACNNPRAVRRLLCVLRDLAVTGNLVYERGYDMSEVLRYADVTADGLNRTARTYLVKLLDTFAGKSGVKALQGTLGVPLDEAERTLLDRELITRTASGREITPLGVRRAESLKSQWVRAA